MKNVKMLLEEMTRAAEERVRIDLQIEQYKRQLPSICAQWDTSVQSISANDIAPDIVKGGMRMYTCDIDSLWKGLFDPSVYDSATLWGDRHDSAKIARIISNWENGIKLPPIFLVKHGLYPLGLVSDGNHRLTVSKAIHTKSIPFVTARSNCSWVLQALPSAKMIGEAEQGDTAFAHVADH